MTFTQARLLGCFVSVGLLAVTMAVAGLLAPTIPVSKPEVVFVPTPGKQSTHETSVEQPTNSIAQEEK